MAGTVRAIGYDRNANGPDLAQVGANEQLVSHVQNNSPASSFIAYAIKGYVGNWLSQAEIRYAIWATASASAAPGGLLARTVPVDPTVNYVDAAGGQARTLNLETPILIEPSEWVALGIGSAGSAAGVAMFQASAISQPNESFYRKGISGNNVQSASGSTSSNEGQLALAIFGEYNVAPTAPTGLLPSGQITTRTPNIEAVFNDANKTLNNGVKWDYASKTRIQVSTNAGTSGIIWDEEYSTSSSERNNHRTVRRYNGQALNFYTTYHYRVQHTDRAGAVGAFSGWQSFSIKHTNNAPNLPSGFTGSGNQLGTQSVTISAAFTDADLPTLPDGQAWEVFTAKQIIVRRVSDNAVVWNPGVVTTSSSEKNSKRSSTTWTIPAWDTDYRWYERHRDRSGAWSTSYASVLIKAVSGASADKPTSPVGRVTNRANPGVVSAVYRSTGGQNATQWQIGLFNENGVLVDASPVFGPTSIAPNTVMNAAWASTEFGTLAPDTIYQIRVRVFVNAAQGWSSWSIGSIITTNAIPNMPTLYGPQDNVARSTLPLLSVNASDADAPDGSLTIPVEIYASDGATLLGSVIAYSNSAGGQFPRRYSADVSSIITGYGTYKWRALAFDGYEYSAWSPMWTLPYASVPSVIITAPTGPTVTTREPTLLWNAPGQTAWRVQARDATQNIVYDTGVVNNSSQGHFIRTDHFWVAGERWNNDETFAWTAMVQDSSTLWGSSEPLTLTLEYIPPASLIVDGMAMSLQGVRGTHYGQLTHNPSDYAEGEFLYYEWDRVEIDGPAGPELPGTYIANFARITDSSVTSLIDFDMTSNRWYRWGVRQVIQAGVDVIPSDPVYVELMVSWHGTLLHMPFDPINNYVWLQYGAAGDRYRPSRRRESDDRSVAPMHLKDPLDFGGRQRRVSTSGEYTFIPREDMSAIDQMDVIDRMFDYQYKDASPDGRPHIMCWREGRGGRRGRLYVRLLSIEDCPTIGRTQSVGLEFAERHYVLGVQGEESS